MGEEIRVIMDTISVIIVNWNGRKWLQKILSSLTRQTYQKIEIIVVDNKSTDDSITFIRKKFSKVRIIQSKHNSGFATANTLGIKSSKGKYVMLINNDTWVKKNFVEQLYSFYKNNPYDIISPVEYTYDQKKRIDLITTIDITGSAAYYFPKNIHTKLFFLGGLCLFFSKDFYFKTHGLDNNFFMYFEDVDWFWRLTLLGKQFARVDSIPIYHAGAGSSGGGIKYNLFLWRNQNILQMLIKNYSLPLLIVVMPIYLLQNLFEIALFLVMRKPRIAYTYILGWVFNIKYLCRTLKERAWIQKNRTISDFPIIRRMFLGIGKIQSLIIYIRTKYEKSV